MEDDGDGTVEALVEAMAMHEEAFSAVPLNPAERVSPPREDEEEEEDTQAVQPSGDQEDWSQRACKRCKQAKQGRDYCRVRMKHFGAGHLTEQESDFDDTDEDEEAMRIKNEKKVDRIPFVQNDKRRRRIVQTYDPEEDGGNDQNRHQRKAQAAKVGRLRERYPNADHGLLVDVLQESHGHEKVCITNLDVMFGLKNDNKKLVAKKMHTLGSNSAKRRKVEQPKGRVSHPSNRAGIRTKSHSEILAKKAQELAKGMAEEECDEESDPEIFECENGCGFEDVTISIVESHEKNCHFGKPDNSVLQMLSEQAAGIIQKIGREFHIGQPAARACFEAGAAMALTHAEQNAAAAPEPESEPEPAPVAAPVPAAATETTVQDEVEYNWHPPEAMLLFDKVMKVFRCNARAFACNQVTEDTIRKDLVKATLDLVRI